MQKFFVNKNQIDGKQISIIGSDVNHIINVLRIKKNEKIQVGNKDTLENYIAKIINCSKEKVTCQIVETIQNSIESNIEIDLYQGLPKADKMELIIQKTTEIGICNIIPVETCRTIVKIEGKDEEKKIIRWQKIAEVAAKQSKRNKIPNIKPKININKLCEKIKEYDLFLVAYEEEKQNKLKDILQKIKDNNKNIKIGFFIGPEGGIDENEVKILKENGANIVTLGNRILRTETAPIVLSSIIIYELEK